MRLCPNCNAVVTPGASDCALCGHILASPATSAGLRGWILHRERGLSRLLAAVALLGFLLSLLAHVASIFGVDVQSDVSEIWLLHVGMFIVFVPMVLASMNSDIGAIFRGLPAAAAVLLGILIPYAVVNFFILAGSAMSGLPAVRDGAYVIERRGEVVRQISEEEYRARRADELRAMSAYWLAFYYVPFAFFYSRARTRTND